eukprot:gene4712-4962_t
MLNQVILLHVLGLLLPDQCDRVRKAAGGKVKPGQPMLRTDSEDLATMDSPSANSSASNSPSRGWMMAAGGREGALHQSWPGPNQTGSVSKGLFSKLMSKKNKKQDAALPASPTLESSPYNMQLGIGSGLKASRSIEALHQASEHFCADDSCPSTPTTSKALGDPRDGSDEGGFVSCYATPVGSEAMDSPASNLYPEGYSANATLDLCQQMAFESTEEGVPIMDMARELPDVFTPGFNQLLQGGSRLQAVQLGSPGDSQYGELEPTIALVSAAQLAQAGCLQDQPSSELLGTSQAVAAAALPMSFEDKPGVLSADALLDAVDAQTVQQAVSPAGAADVKPAADAELQIAGGSGVRTASGAEAAPAQPQQLEIAFEETGARTIMAVAAVDTNVASCVGSSNTAGNAAAFEGLIVLPGTREEDTDGPLEEEASLPLPTAEDSITSVASEGQDDSPQPHSDTNISSQAAAPQGNATATTRSHIHQRKLSPMAVVRESMPLFVSDPTRAMGSPLRLDIEDDSLDAQDMQLLAQANTSTSSRSTGTAIAGVAEGVGSAGAHSRLLCHGAAQRVAMGRGAAGGFLGGLAPVEEASFTSCSPEESPTAAHDNAGSSGTLSPQYEGVEVGMAVMSPLRTRQREGSVPQMTPAAAEGALDLGMSPGSAYSTPVLAVQGGHERGSLQGATPQSAVSSAIGSAIRSVPCLSSAAGSGREFSPAMPGMAGPSPTLTLLPTLSGQGLSATSGGAREGDGSTPSLLDIRAASPSAVYGMRFTATPFRGALAALPLDAALHAPLVDSSPFNLTDDGGLDTVCLADEAQRLAQNLAAAAGGFGPSSPAAQTPAAGIKQAAVATPSSAGDRSAGAGSPTDELRDLHVVMLTKQLAEVQKRAKELEVESLRLREQVEIYEFEKTELNSQEEMEKQARQYAEEQLQQLQVEIQQLLQAKSAQASQMLSMRQEFEGFQQEAQRQHEAMLQQHAALQGTIAQAQQERDDVLDRLNLLDMQLTAMTSHNSDLSAALEAQRQRCAELEATLAARDRDVAEAARLQAEAQAKVEKAMEQVIAANTAKEHVKQKATDEIAKVQQMLLERQQLMAEREKRVQDYQHLKQKYAQKSAALKEAEKRCQDRDAENQELMAMCDQLLQQQEAGRAAKAGG